MSLIVRQGTSIRLNGAKPIANCVFRSRGPLDAIGYDAAPVPQSTEMPPIPDGLRAKQP